MKPITARALVVIKLAYTLLIILIKQRLEAHIAVIWQCISENILSFKKKQNSNADEAHESHLVKLLALYKENA